MAYTTVFEGIIFIEGGHPEARILQNAKVDLSFKIGAQLKNLNDVKREFVSKVKAAGGNCLLDFEYGQKSRWLAIDDVAFWGSGKIALLPQASYDEIISRK